MFDLAGGFNKIDAIIIVFFNTSRDRKNIRVKNDVFSWKANLFNQDFIGSLTDFDFALQSICLTNFIEGHNDYSRTIATYQSGLFDKLVFSFFQRNGVDDTFTLYAFQTRFKNLPFRRVQHHRYPRDIRFSSDQIQKAHHGGF